MEKIVENFFSSLLNLVKMVKDAITLSTNLEEKLSNIYLHAFSSLELMMQLAYKYYDT